MGVIYIYAVILMVCCMYFFLECWVCKDLKLGFFFILGFEKLGFKWLGMLIGYEVFVVMMGLVEVIFCKRIVCIF